MLGLNVDNLLAGFKKDMAGFQTQVDGMGSDLSAIRNLLEQLVKQGEKK